MNPEGTALRRGSSRRHGKTPHPPHDHRDTRSEYNAVGERTNGRQHVSIEPFRRGETYVGTTEVPGRDRLEHLVRALSRNGPSKRKIFFPVAGLEERRPRRRL